MAEHPLFEKLMARLDEIAGRLDQFEQMLTEQSSALRRAEGALASMERDMRGTDGIIEDVAILAEEARRREWHSMLPKQARDNIRRAS